MQCGDIMGRRSGKGRGVRGMIFQFKITLKDSKPPIWRRFEVKDTMTFYDLHKMIQIGFDWADSHLHGFVVKKSNGSQVYI